MEPAQSARLKASAPNIRAVAAAGKRRLALNWKGGAESLVDVGPHLDRFALFAPLHRSPAAFARVRVGDWGWSVQWSEEMEIAADTLWRLALEQGAGFLRGWREAHGMTQSEAAKALGVSPRMWRYYEAGTHLLPKTVRLAAAGFDAQKAA